MCLVEVRRSCHFSVSCDLDTAFITTMLRRLLPEIGHLIGHLMMGDSLRSAVADLPFP